MDQAEETDFSIIVLLNTRSWHSSESFSSLALHCSITKYGVNTQYTILFITKYLAVTKTSSTQS